MTLQELPKDSELKFPHIMQVHASAGSGKTYILSLRFLQFLLSDIIKDNSPGQILAITFTNAATEEMKRRILLFLKSIYLKSDKQLIDQIQRITTTKNLIQKAGKLVDHIISNYDEFRIKTIDSFVNLIIRASTYELGLPPEYEIVSNYTEIIDLAFSHLISRVAEDDGIKKVFFEFIDRSINDNFRPWDQARNLIQEFFEFENTYSMEIKTLPSGSLEKIVQELIDVIKEILANPVSISEKGQESLKLILRGDRNPENILKTFSKRKILKGIKDSKLRERLEKKLGELSISTMTHGIKNVFELYRLTREEVERLKRRNRLILLSELNLRINRFLEEASPTWIYYKLGESIRHYLIDEFQDTSELQWANIEPLIENALANGGSLFYVGDLKQLLYRYRGSSFRTFSFPPERFPGFTIYPLILRRNWRSRKNIVDYNNKVFRVENLKKLTEPAPDKGKRSAPLLDLDTFKRVKDVYKDSIQDPNKEDGGYIRVKVATGKNEKESFIEWLEEILPDLIERFGYSNIAILLRTNAHVEFVSKYLLMKGIPVISRANLDVRNHYVIRAIINLLEFLDFPPDNLSFAKFISSEPFEKLTHLEFEDWLLQKRELQENPLYREFRNDFPHIWEMYLDELFKSVGYLPPYDLLWQITEKLKLFENYTEAEAFIQKFMEITYNLEENGALSLKDILERIHNAPRDIFSLDTPENGDAVVVSTVHSAKGLEFDVVVTWPVRSKRRGRRSIKFYNRGDKSYVFKSEKIFTEFNKILDSIHKETIALETIDELNSLYVAATRARSELYVYFPQNNDFKRLFEEFPEYGEPVNSPAKSERRRKKRYSWAGYKLKNWYDHLANTITKPFELKEPVRRGDLIHRVLARIETLSFKPGELHFLTYMKEIVSTTIHELGFSSIDEDELLKSFETFFGDPVIQKFFSGGEIYTEKEIFSENGEHLRIDRIVVRDNRIEVVEFKTGEPEISKHKHQVLKYVRTIEKLHPDREVKGYIIYFDDVKVVEV